MKLTTSALTVFDWLKRIESIENGTTISTMLKQSAPYFMTQELDRNQCIHGRPQKIFQGATSKFFLSSSGCWRCNANGRSQNALPFYPISLCWLDLNSQSFVWNVFYTSSIRNAFSFNELPNIHLWEHYLQISHNLKAINGQNNMEMIINDSACKNMQRHETFRSWLFSKSTHWQRPRSIQ